MGAMCLTFHKDFKAKKIKEFLGKNRIKIQSKKTG